MVTKLSVFEIKVTTSPISSSIMSAFSFAHDHFGYEVIEPPKHQNEVHVKEEVTDDGFVLFTTKNPIGLTPYVRTFYLADAMKEQHDHHLVEENVTKFGLTQEQLDDPYIKRVFEKYPFIGPFLEVRHFSNNRLLLHLLHQTRLLATWNKYRFLQETYFMKWTLEQLVEGLDDRLQLQMLCNY